MTRIEELRKRIEEERAGYKGIRFRCSKELKREVTEAGHALIAEGWTRARLARAIGLCTGTVTRLLSKGNGEGAGGFRRVELTSDRGFGLSLVTPSGVRVEGLDIEQVKHLLREIR